jgi:hypothetical protein
LLGRFYVSTTYKYQQGLWINSPNAPPAAAVTGVLALPAPGVPAGGGVDTTNPGGVNTGQGNMDINNKM